jgi:integrase/recombinase XerD
VPLVAYLRAKGVVPVPVPVEASTPLDRLLADYRNHLLNERGLSLGVCSYREASARRFLESRSDATEGVLRLESLTAAEVVDYVTSACVGRNAGTAKLQVDGLRSLLRFLHLAGRISRPLTLAVPAVAGHRSTGLPKALTTEQTARLLAGCDRSRAVGRRDFAVLMLLARLGLRAGEVAALCLNDFDWRAGEILIRGKGNRVERLPLPSAVGEAVVAYLQDGRPSPAGPRLFRTARAPQRAMSSEAVKGVVREACRRAGLPEVGAHRLRHTAATEMLNAGVGLSDVAQALRQRSLATTSIYAKVDRATLRTLAQPWPEVAP